MSRLILGDDVVLPHASASGIRVNQTSPTFTWREILGEIAPKSSGAGSPARTTFRGNVKAMAFILNDEVDMQYHIPHDWVPGTDLFFHYHWAHNGTNISGNLVVSTYMTYAKGHNQSVFPSDITHTTTVSTPDLTTIPQYSHRLNETQLSASSPSGSQFDTDDIEVDGLIIATAKVTTLPSITGGSLFLFQGDIHYLSKNIGTVAKVPNFYVP